jgi:hypothetical protein
LIPPRAPAPLGLNSLVCMPKLSRLLANVTRRSVVRGRIKVSSTGFPATSRSSVFTSIVLAAYSEPRLIRGFCCWNIHTAPSMKAALAIAATEDPVRGRNVRRRGANSQFCFLAKLGVRGLLSLSLL